MVAGAWTGDRVAIHWFNSLEAVYVVFACLKSGLIAVPINVRLKAPEVAYALAHSQSAMCFAQPELASVTEAATAAGPN
jgi:acyl-CoA synthetase (AMP-forming)/AMP-acid ligase II